MTAGLFIGRFQPFHNGHLADIKLALKEVDQLIIGIGSSQHEKTKDNPFSFEERARMIENVLIKEEISNYTIFPIPDFNNDKKWVEHLEVLLPKFKIIYSGNDRVLNIFKPIKKFKTKRLELIDNISSTKIRNFIKEGKQWEKLVPKEIVEYIKKIDGTKRIK
ncbi:nicotinamide-nucleotide adenylyltransferase [Nanoarchaeota archaeon]